MMIGIIDKKGSESRIRLENDKKVTSSDTYAI